MSAGCHHQSLTTFLALEAAWDPERDGLGSSPWTSATQAHSPGPCRANSREKWVLKRQGHPLPYLNPFQKRHQEALAWGQGRLPRKHCCLSGAFFQARGLPGCPPGPDVRHPPPGDVSLPEVLGRTLLQKGKSYCTPAALQNTQSNLTKGPQNLFQDSLEACSLGGFL